MKAENLETEKNRKSLTGRNGIRPACSQTRDRGFGVRNEGGREGRFSGGETGLQPRGRGVYRKMGAY